MRVLSKSVSGLSAVVVALGMLAAALVATAAPSGAEVAATNVAATETATSFNTADFYAVAEDPEGLLAPANIPSLKKRIFIRGSDVIEVRPNVLCLFSVTFGAFATFSWLPEWAVPSTLISGVDGMIIDIYAGGVFGALVPPGSGPMPFDRCDIDVVFKEDHLATYRFVKCNGLVQVNNLTSGDYGLVGCDEVVRF